MVRDRLSDSVTWEASQKRTDREPRAYLKCNPSRWTTQAKSWGECTLGVLSGWKGYVFGWSRVSQGESKKALGWRGKQEPGHLEPWRPWKELGFILM